MKVLSIQGHSARDFLTAMSEHKRYRWVEMRADSAPEEIDLHYVRSNFSGKIIFTCRDFNSDFERVKNLYIRAAKAAFDYLDLDYEFYMNTDSSFRQCLQQSHSKLIISFHNYLDSRITLEGLDRMFSVPADLYKIGLQLSDAWEGFALMKSRKNWQKPVVLALMGEAGEWSRICYKLIDNPWTYLCLPGKQTGPGQVDVLRWETEFSRVPERDWDLYGVLGERINHSFSPYFHNRLFKKRKLKATYLRFPASNIELFFQLAPSSLKGLSITTPFKRSVLPFLKSHDHLVEASGSCNTLVRGDQGWVGWNTDASGLRLALDSIMPGWIEKEKVVILGTGGMARSALAALCDQKEKIYLWNRNEFKALELAAKFGVNTLPTDEIIDLEHTILIQATSAGFGEPDISPIPPHWLKQTTTLVESIYHPRYTCLVKEAMSQGLEVLQAVDIFLFQALEQQRIWFGDQAFTLKEGRKVLS